MAKSLQVLQISKGFNVSHFGVLMMVAKSNFLKLISQTEF